MGHSDEDFNKIGATWLAADLERVNYTKLAFLQERHMAPTATPSPPLGGRGHLLSGGTTLGVRAKSLGPFVRPGLLDFRLNRCSAFWPLLAAREVPSGVLIIKTACPNSLAIVIIA